MRLLSTISAAGSCSPHRQRHRSPSCSVNYNASLNGHTLCLADTFPSSVHVRPNNRGPMYVNAMYTRRGAWPGRRCFFWGTTNYQLIKQFALLLVIVIIISCLVCSTKLWLQNFMKPFISLTARTRCP